jgi:glycoprotein-N-acetylgalactosamine 3-beta-galactosyltransferase
LPTVAVPIHGPESREQLWNKAKFTLRFVYDNYLDDYDWFFKADDDT